MSQAIEMRSIKNSALSDLKSAPYLIIALRFGLIPLLWAFALLGMSRLVGFGLILACVLDFLDGLIARRLNQVAEFGAMFDSLADNLLAISAILWMLILEPDAFARYPGITIVVTLIYITSIFVGLMKFKRYGNPHLYTSKAAAVMLYVFAIHSFLSADYSASLFFVAAGFFLLSSTETLIIQLISAVVDEHQGSLLLAMKRRNKS